MSNFIVTEHCIIPKESIIGVTVVKNTEPIAIGYNYYPATYSIVGHTANGENTIPLYVDISHNQIPEKMKILAGQLSPSIIKK